MVSKMRKRVIIVGFGDTGLLVAINLSRRYDILGISPKPCLVSGQELGTRLTQPKTWQNNYLMGFDRYRALQGVKTLHGSVNSIKPDKNELTVLLANGELCTETYDVLVIASGVTNGFWRTNTLEHLGQIKSKLTEQSKKLTDAKNVAIVGAGPTGVSVASNLKEQCPDTEVNLFISQDTPLPGYHPKVRAKVTEHLKHQGVFVHSGYRAKLPDDASMQQISPGTIEWQTGQSDFKADAILWAIGNLKPNSRFLPASMLNEEGFVNVDSTLRVSGYENVFAVGDIANTDANRSSARNAGFLTVAKNIDAYVNNRPNKMKTFKPTQYRWGSILGVQNNGMRVFTPKGGSVLVSRWWVNKLLFPFFVWRMIYKGLQEKQSSP